MVHTARHPQPGETLLGSGGTITAGGKGANQAVAAARLGAQVSFVGAVGNDAYATPAMHYLQASGVDLTHVEASEEVTGSSWSSWALAARARRRSWRGA